MGSEVTQLLADLSRGRDGAVDDLLPVVYGELRKLASNLLNGERSDHTLQATALVHEAYLKLAGQRAVSCENRAHFMAVAATAMRRILVDYARTKKRKKRGGERKRIALDDAGLTIEPGASSIDLIALDDALLKLTQIQPQAGRVVEMRYFGGVPTDDIALVLSVSRSTVEREWRYARAWLFDELECDGGRRQQ